MKTFYLNVTETLNKTVEVQAETYEEAKEKVQNAYDNEEIVLDYNDFVEYEIYDNTDSIIYTYELGGMPKFYEVK